MSPHHTLAHDCPAKTIPTGEVVSLPAGTEVGIVQTLGGNATVRTARGLFRIAREDTVAIGGYVPAPDPTGAEPVGEFNESVVWGALRTCFDPEIPVNIVDLGLIYDLAIEPTPGGGQAVEVKMTLTAAGCGMGPVMAEDARDKISRLPRVTSAKVHIVWEPPWTPQMISETGRKVLGLE